MTRILVTSASGADGDGYGAILCFGADGALAGAFGHDPRIIDPRGLSVDSPGELVYVNSGDDRVLALNWHGEVALDSGRIDRLDPGGGAFGPDGRYYVGLRQRRTILALPALLDGPGEPLLPDGIVPFPRGFAFGPEGELYLASGIGPSGRGDNTIAVFDQGLSLRTSRLVDDPELSPLDLAVAPSGNIVVSSEWPFGHSCCEGERSGVRGVNGPARAGPLPPRPLGSLGPVDCGSEATVVSIALARITW